MEYTIRRGEPVPAEVKRIIDSRVGTAIEHIDGGMGLHETVHEVRKRCKEVRAAMRLVRPVFPTYSEENAHYRDAARRVSDSRDAQATVETFDTHVRPAAEDNTTLEENTLANIRTTLVERRDNLANEQALDEQLESVRADLVEGRERIDAFLIKSEGYGAMADGLRKSYKRARNRMDEAYENPEFERFHEWRKRVEYHRDHVGLFRRGWDGPMTVRREELQSLTETLGDETDLAEFATTIQEEKLFDRDTRNALVEVSNGRRSQLQRQGRPLGERLFAETPDRIVARFEQYWNAPTEIEHDADNLTIADSSGSSKPKPKPKPDSAGDTGDGDQTEPTIMQEYSDRWYVPDSDTYEYAVRTPDGNRAYRKTQDGAVGVLEQHYGGDNEKRER